MLRQVMLISLLLMLPAFALTQSRSPASCVNNDGCANECMGSVAWTNAANAKASDTTFANTTNLNEISNTNWLFCSQYNFSIPAGSTVNNIYIDMERLRQPTSFPKGTLIATPAGTLPVESLKINDTILGFNNSTDGITPVHVLGNPVHNATDNRRIITIFGSVETTDMHPFWTQRGWVIAKDLQAGDQLTLFAGGRLNKDVVVSSFPIGGKTEVWTLATDGTNTYFANGFAVHNKGTNPAVFDFAIYFQRGTPAASPSGYEKAGEWGTAENTQRYVYPTDTPANLNNTAWGVWLSATGGPDFIPQYGLVDFINVTVDYTPPAAGPVTSINFTAPTTNASNVTQNWIAANATFANSNNASILLYNASGSLLSSYNSSTSPISTNFTGLATGLYYLNATATNNTTASTETRAINITATSIQFAANTTAAGSYAQEWIYAAVTATWASNTTIWLYNGTTLINSTNASGNTSSVNYTGLGAGFYKINATSRNPVSTANTETRNITLRVWCYQEQANVSTACGGLDTGSYAYENEYIYMNYTKPTNALNTSKWQVKHAGIIENSSIASDCWNRGTDLMLREHTLTVALIEFGTPDSNGQCYNGTTWKLITTNSTSGGASVSGSTGTPPETAYDGNYSSLANFYNGVGWRSDNAALKLGADLYEEAMFWDMNTTLPAADSCSCPASPANYVIQLADKCNFTTSCNMGANTITFNGSTGYATFNNVSLNPLTFTASKICWKGTNSSYLWFKTSTWFNGTMSGC